MEEHTVVTKRTVSCQVNVVFVTILDKLGLGKEWVCFNLVDSLVSRVNGYMYE